MVDENSKVSNIFRSLPSHRAVDSSRLVEGACVVAGIKEGGYNSVGNEGGVLKKGRD